MIRHIHRHINIKNGKNKHSYLRVNGIKNINTLYFMNSIIIGIIIMTLKTCLRLRTR